MSKAIENAKRVLANQGLAVVYTTYDAIVFAEKHKAEAHAQRFPEGKNGVEEHKAIDLLDDGDEKVKELEAQRVKAEEAAAAQAAQTEAAKKSAQEPSEEDKAAAAAQAEDEDLIKKAGESLKAENTGQPDPHANAGEGAGTGEGDEEPMEIDLDTLGFEDLKTLASKTYELDITGLNSKEKLRDAIMTAQAKDLEVNE